MCECLVLKPVFCPPSLLNGELHLVVLEQLICKFHPGMDETILSILEEWQLHEYRTYRLLTTEELCNNSPQKEILWRGHPDSKWDEQTNSISWQHTSRCVDLGKCLHLSVPSFPVCKSGHLKYFHKLMWKWNNSALIIGLAKIRKLDTMKTWLTCWDIALLIGRHMDWYSHYREWSNSSQLNTCKPYNSIILCVGISPREIFTQLHKFYVMSTL